MIWNQKCFNLYIQYDGVSKLTQTDPVRSKGSKDVRKSKAIPTWTQFTKQDAGAEEDQRQSQVMADKWALGKAP